MPSRPRQSVPLKLLGCAHVVPLPRVLSSGSWPNVARNWRPLKLAIPSRRSVPSACQPRPSCRHQPPLLTNSHDNPHRPRHPRLHPLLRAWPRMVWRLSRVPSPSQSTFALFGQED
ncbi:hypothetical protein BCR44DRAFT_1198740 [Catenaria anguillulae PL171]|uniref:Uncharacterized protein n=1 Tax=Catenaria anguillulae PL171 TaxID=765915 RepID=A0A1Y2HG08_9FUNG|nr:hypothetical protein BCR44DRAFT_1198740 [Catenaria anguillulae PL171]